MIEKNTVAVSRELLEGCADALRRGEAVPETADRIDAMLRQAGDHCAPYRERIDVLTFQQKFKVPMAREPSFLDSETFGFRLRFMQEELNEFETAHDLRDMRDAADALVDLAYVLHGTALMMGLPWPVLWEEVHRRNMQKRRATGADESKRGSALDVVKPDGWKPPDHTPALGSGPWPEFSPGRTK